MGQLPHRLHLLEVVEQCGGVLFSSPIDPSNIWRDYGRSDDDQRHRLVFDGAIHSSMAWANSAWERISHGFQSSGMLQYYSALPFNITSGTTTIQGATARPTVNGAFINRNAGVGNDFFSLSARLSRVFRITERLRMDGIAEAFNVLNHRNNLTLNGTVGSGAYPGNPASTFSQITAVNDPRIVQLALRLSF